MSDHTEKILILDYGSQFTHVIARKIRELGVFCEIFGHDHDDAWIRAYAPDGVILSGGPQSVLDADAPAVPAAVFDLGKPVLGICYGMQAMTRHFGGTVEAGAAAAREYGATDMRLTDADSPLFAGIDDSAFSVWMSHGEHIAQPGEGFRVIAVSGDDGTVAAVANEEKRLYALQCHPEVGHTKNGRQILENFVRRICALHKEWTMPNFVGQETDAIRRAVGGDGVLLALSGGVDSMVVAALVNGAIGEQLTCILVDNGLMREGEVEEVRDNFTRQFSSNLIVADAAARFYDALAGVTDPEEKRRIIGRLFIEVFEEEAGRLGDNVTWLAQGTIYPDVVESAKTGTGKATIKTHHNVGGLPERLKLKLLEPLRELFKDEVRRLGKSLGLNEEWLMRHPFPGPGLAVRVLGEVTPARVETVRRADKIFLDELRAGGVYRDVAQAFAVLLPVDTVGVMGDYRTYENVVALRAVTTDDFMTADWARLDQALLSKVASRIINEVRGVNRVVYDISSKPPATVEWE